MKILVTGLIRNGAGVIESEISTLRAALSSADVLHFLVIESDSSDKTTSQLESLKANIPFFEYISLGELSLKIPERTQRIAHCRNTYLHEIRNNDKYQDLDYIVISDLDGTNSLLNKSSIDSCFKSLDLWDVCTANQRGPYYDLWALRHNQWCPNDCWKDFDVLLKLGIPRHKALWSAVYSKMITIPEDSSLIPVNSAFGGFALYRKSLLLGEIQYNGRNACEHVSFHKDLNARIVINPALINCGINEHNKKAIFPYNLYFIIDGFLLKLINYFRKSKCYKNQ